MLWRNETNTHDPPVFLVLNIYICKRDIYVQEIKVTKTEAEWRAQLTEAEFESTRQKVDEEPNEGNCYEYNHPHTTHLRF